MDVQWLEQYIANFWVVGSNLTQSRFCRIDASRLIRLYLVNTMTLVFTDKVKVLLL